MKPFRLSREGTLKGLLFFALIANLSWEPLANHFSQADLSSNAKDATRPDCTGKDQKSEACVPKSKAERDQAAADAEKARQAVEEAKKKQGKTSAAPDQSKQTEAQATDSCPDCAIKEKDAQIEKLNKTVADLQSKVKAQAATSASSATDPASDSADAADTATDQAAVRPTVDQIRNCEVDAQGNELEDIAAFACEGKLLSTLKARDEASQRSDVLKKIQDLYASLRKDARDDLFSKDTERQRNAEKNISSMISALNKMHFDKEGDREKMVAGLQGLKAGAETRRDALALEDQVNDLEKQMRDTYKDTNKLYKDYQASCRSQSGCDRDMYDDLRDKYADIDDLRHNQWDLSHDIADARVDALDKLDDYKDSISRAELRDYTAPYNKLVSRMRDLGDPRKLQASSRIDSDTTVGSDNRFNGSGQAFIDENGLPDDFFKIRGGDTATRRGNGMFNSTTQAQLPPPPGMSVPGASGYPQPYGQTQPFGQSPQYGFQQQPYTPQYMQVPGAGPQQSLLPPPAGVPMGGRPMMQPQYPGAPMMTSGPMMPGMPGQYGQPMVIPVGQPRTY